MSVIWRYVMSVTKRLKGGGPQGSTKGVLSYRSQSNNNADSVPLEDRCFKYFDDLTVIEVINLLNIGISTARVRDTIPSDLPEHSQLVDNNSLKSQKYLDKKLKLFKLLIWHRSLLK